MLCFNDDIQGTAAVTVGTLLAACAAKGEKLSEQIVTFCGAGSAGCGIAEQIAAQMVAEGLSDQAARARIYLINSRGLITDSMSGLKDFQQGLVQPASAIADWTYAGENPTLAETVKLSKSTVLIGVSAVAGLFDEPLVRQMAANDTQPVILPLSNPTPQIEAHPEDILEWTDGKAIVATGSPFDPVEHGGKLHTISQCNNSYIFPGVGLGVVSSRARFVTDNMMMAASYALAEYAAKHKTDATALLPDLDDIRSVSQHIAARVYRQAIDDGVASARTDEEISEAVAANFWVPDYRPFRRISF